MFRARERGMSFWPFAVCLLGLLIFVFLWFGATSERDNANASLAKAQQAEKKSEEEKNLANSRLLTVSKLVGFMGGANVTDAAELDRQVKEYAAKIKDAGTVTFPISRYEIDANNAPAKADAGTVTVTYLTDAEIADATTLQAWFPKFETALSRAKHDAARAFEHAESLAKDKEALTKANEDTVKEKDKRIGELQSEKTALENQASEKANELNDKIQQLTGQRDAKETEL